MLTIEQKRRERQNKTKARVGSSLLMLLLLLFIVMPFMSLSVLDSELARKKQRKQIVVNFSKEKVKKFEEARSQLSQAPPLSSNPLTAAAAASPPPAAPVPVPVPEPQPAAKKAVAAPSKLPSAATKPLLTSPISKMPSLPSLPKLFGKKKSKKPVEEALPEEETGEGEIEVTEAASGKGEPAEKSGTGTDANAKADKGRGTSEDGGSSSNPSDGIAGTGDKPSDGTSGVGESDGPGEGEGNGEFGAFGRKRIHAPSSAGLATKDGKVTLKICVNQDGKVTYAKAMEEGTTFYDSDILINAAELMKKYRFEKDYSAPVKQCGKYTFIVYPE